MIFEFSATRVTGLLKAFAEAIGSTVEKDKVQLPAHIGNGYIKGVIINPGFRIMIRQYELKEELIIKRKAINDGSDIIVIAFHNFSAGRKEGSTLQQGKDLPSVQITTASIVYEDFFPVNATINTIIITIHAGLLKELLQLNDQDVFLQNLIYGGQPFLYEEVLSGAMQQVAEKILAPDVPDAFRELYYRTKAEELIYLLFVALAGRQYKDAYLMNIADTKMIYQLRDKIIADLSLPPQLPQLAKFSGMSTSKMNRLFKVVFGNTIYDYFQRIRMEEAADLLKHKRHSVSETGYRLGFSNLRHFTRMFEKHIGTKPKKYATTYNTASHNDAGKD